MVGSVNADIYVEVERLPKEEETVVARSGQTFAGGKGANQASCAARLSYPTYLVGQVRADVPIASMLNSRRISHGNVGESRKPVLAE